MENELEHGIDLVTMYFLTLCNDPLLALYFKFRSSSSFSKLITRHTLVNEMLLT